MILECSFPLICCVCFCPCFDVCVSQDFIEFGADLVSKKPTSLSWLDFPPSQITSPLSEFVEDGNALLADMIDSGLTKFSSGLFNMLP